MASTDRFTATHTTSKAMTVAAQMMAMGADQRKVVQGLYGERNKGRQDRPQQKPQQAQPQSQPRQEQPKPKPKMQAEIYEKAGLEPGGTIRDRAVFINSEPEIHAPLEGVEMEQPSMVIEHVQAVVDQKVEHPVSEPAQQVEVPQTHEFETDGPVITDPDDLPTVQPVQIEDSAPEPLINDQPTTETAEQKPAQSDSPKRSNPTNNPIFANRLS